MKKKASKRNRHTGLVNKFKTDIIMKGKGLRIGDEQYYRKGNFGTIVKG